MNTGLYIHLPFCKQKCKYCDFASFAGQENLVEPYLDALSKEAARSPVKNFQTLYVGGGTPSLLSADQLAALCQVIVQNFGPIAAFSESTLEANPESLTPQKIAVLREFGFNRLSLGLQSFNDAELKTIGRVHNAATFLKAYQTAHQGGFTNINVDLIAGLPGQTLDSFLHSLAQVVSLSPEHLSVYGLQVEENTPLFESGFVCDQLLMRRMLEQTHWRLEQAGYHHYEISNFAKSGREARHNTLYWHNGPYVGLGSSAASYTGGVRRQNTPSVSDYTRCMAEGKSPVVFSERLAGKAREGESVLLGLRLLDGLTLSSRQERFFGKEIEKHIPNGLLERAGKKVKLTFEGLFLANEVICSFVAPFEEA